MDNRKLKKFAYGAGFFASVIGVYLCYKTYMSKYKRTLNLSIEPTDAQLDNTSFEFNPAPLLYEKDEMTLTKPSLLQILRDLKDHFIHHVHELRRQFRDERRPYQRDIPAYEKIVNQYNE